MKKIIIGSLILFTVVTGFYGCRKNDNPKLPEGIETGVFPKLTQDPAGDELIQDVNSFSTAFTLDVFYPKPLPQKMDVRVVMNDDYTNVKTLKADVTSFPTKITVTGPQLAQLFGLTPDQVEIDDQFTISPDITLQSGKLLTAFAYGVNGTDTFNLAPYGGDALNTPGANTILTYKKVCTLNIDSLSNVKGGGAMILDDPDVLESSYPVTLTKENDSTIRINNYATVPGAILKLKIIQKSQTIVIDKQAIAPSFPGYPYHNWVAKGTGTINACDNSMTLKVSFSVDEGAFDPVTQTIKRPE
ncbi:hypothetical protein SAMN05660909_04240 [Chitinophaga terrae (ex Kim and Jung 2007)]|uniref:Uncharacterized protein n=1 Tax=Chitinophaga terrae (ex Kim and Jung 2007) TaxID=408074 RepID=A0A1H4F8P1_9BACT|nr:hypothetical protein [Chitinophaga terrae (ex Kim and Jung 2007)]SEA93706.1 hypothetical protein SAMN05660909_04240 [Chitinophaga terrae (ex Kim and Jung 2007)]